MAEPATDVGTESTFTMLYIAVLESKGKDHWDQCCHSISPKNVSPEALQRIPRNHANKVLVRMEDSLLNKWFAACQVISETVVQVFQELNVETASRKDVFPQLLKRLGFKDRESEELCRSVDRFYTELFNMHTHGNDTSASSRQAPSMRGRKHE